MALADVLAEIEELRRQDGTAADKTDALLRQRGWKRYLDDIPDDDFRDLIRRALDDVFGGDRLRKSRSTKASMETRTRRAIASGAHQLSFDDIVGMRPDMLVQHLPFETYWVESLGREVSRDELPSQLLALRELHDTAEELRRDHDTQAKWYGRQVSIFAELIRQAGGYSEAAE